MSESHRDKVFDEEKRSDYLWCLHCERTYQRGKWREQGDLQMCPYQDCGGDAVIDAWDWEAIRDNKPEHPVVPETGKSYPMY